MKDHLRRIQEDLRAIKDRQRRALEAAAQLIAAPGVEVEVIRKPWPVGQRGRVWAVYQEGADWFADVTLGGWVKQIPLSALARPGSQVDCATAQIGHKISALKFYGTEFLE